MQRIVMSDVIALARALRAVPERRRARLLSCILQEARAAAAFVRLHRRTHPRFGNGSVMAASAAHRQVPEPWLEDRDYCRCLLRIFAHLRNVDDPLRGETERSE